MVRGPAALLGVYAAGLAYFLLAPSLPALHGGDAATLVAGSAGLLVLGACALVALQARDQVPALVLVAIGSGILSGGLVVARAGAGADVFQALLAAAIGMLFARALAHPSALITIPLFVAGIDIVSVVGGPSSTLIHQQPRVVDFLSFQLPAWGSGSSAQLGLSDVIFLTMFASWALAFGLRARVTAALLVGALPAALVVSVLAHSAIPVLPLLAGALLLPNADRLAKLLLTPAA